jgi:hypothetical protein
MSKIFQEVFVSRKFMIETYTQNYILHDLHPENSKGILTTNCTECTELAEEEEFIFSLLKRRLHEGRGQRPLKNETQALRYRRPSFTPLGKLPLPVDIAVVRSDENGPHLARRNRIGRRRDKS